MARSRWEKHILLSRNVKEPHQMAVHQASSELLPLVAIKPRHHGKTHFIHAHQRARKPSHIEEHPHDLIGEDTFSLTHVDPVSKGRLNGIRNARFVRAAQDSVKKAALGPGQRVGPVWLPSEEGVNTRFTRDPRVCVFEHLPKQQSVRFGFCMGVDLTAKQAWFRTTSAKTNPESVSSLVQTPARGVFRPQRAGSGRCSGDAWPHGGSARSWRGLRVLVAQTQRKPGAGCTRFATC
jgi:hypothetical protein